MSIDKHRKPNGNYDGIGVMSEISGLSRDDITEIAEQVKSNHAKLHGCAYHDFKILTECLGKAHHKARYRCVHCQGEIDLLAYRWHEKGHRPRPEALEGGDA